MTNGEKLIEVFPSIELYEKSHDAIQINFDSAWWNSEYKEPTTKNNLGVVCIDKQATLDAIIKRLGISNESYLLPAEKTIYQQIKDMPSVTPQEPKIKVLERDEAMRKLGAVDIYQASAWITLLNDLEYLKLKICEVEE